MNMSQTRTIVNTGTVVLFHHTTFTIIIVGASRVLAGSFYLIRIRRTHGIVRIRACCAIKCCVTFCKNKVQTKYKKTDKGLINNIFVKEAIVPYSIEGFYISAYEIRNEQV